MKKTLSLMVAAATLIASVPLSFADDSSSSSAASSSSSMVSSSSSSSSSSYSRMFTVKDTGPCADKKGLTRVLCILSVVKGRNASSSSIGHNRMKWEAKDIVDVCKDKKGLDKANCLHLGIKIVKKVNSNAVEHSNTMSGPCSGLRGGARGLCMQGLEKHRSSSSSSSMSSSSESSESSSSSSL